MTDSRNQTAPWGTYAPKAFASAWLGVLHSLPASAFWRRIALWLRKPLKNRFGPWVDIEVWGLRLRLRTQGNLSEQRMIFMPQFLDRIEREALANHLSGGGCFLDIGANAGAYSLWVASLQIPGTRIEAFEPDPDLCGSLQFNLETNAIQSVQLHPLALGRSNGRAKLVSGSGNKGENHVETSDTTEGHFVEMSTLPHFLESQKIERIDALKIDIEGHEYDVLEPLFSNSPKSCWPRLLICEVVHDGENKLAALLSEHGYRLATSGRLNGIYRLES